MSGGARPPPFTLSTISSKVVVYALEEMADTLPYFSSIPICTLWAYEYCTYLCMLMGMYFAPPILLLSVLYICTFYHFWPRNLSGLITGGRCWWGGEGLPWGEGGAGRRGHTPSSPGCFNDLNIPRGPGLLQNRFFFHHINQIHPPSLRLLWGFLP